VRVELCAQSGATVELNVNGETRKVVLPPGEAVELDI